MAVIAKQRYKLDITPKGGWVIIYASQHDDDAREIEFEITNQGNAYSIPASINISVQGVKSNKGYFSHSCSYTGNIVKMALANDMTDVIGKAICVLKFTNSSQQKLATAKFVLNVDTDSSSEGVIVDTEAEEIFNQMLNEIRAQAASVSADIAELQSMVGSPLVASTVSAMTDHNKIYVYTGSQSGYTNGNWYYWNGSAWTSGGVYNSTAFETDKTLSVENMAADAAEVGKIAGDLKDYNCADMLSKYVPKASTTSLGVTYIWDRDTCHVSGTSTGISQHNIIADPVGLGGLEGGKTYRVKYSGTDVMLMVYFYDATNYEGTQTRYIYYDDAVFTVPVGSKSTIIRLRVNNGKTVDEHVEPHLLTAESNEELGERVEALQTAISESEQSGTTSGSGNPLVLKNTADADLNSIELSQNGVHTIKCFGKNLAQPLNPDATTRVASGVTFTFDNEAGSIRIQSETGATADTVSGNVSTTINGATNTFNYKLHVKESCYVTVAPNCKQLQAYIGESGNVTMQVWHLLNGSNFAQRIKETNFTMHLQAGEEIGIRFFVRSGWKGDLTFYPQIEIGTHATAFEPVKFMQTTDLSAIKSKEGITTLICDDDVTITATAKTRTTKESAINANVLSLGFNSIIADRMPELYRRYKRSTKPIITFTDDDTSSVALVTRYYNALHSVGAVGNYAVITNTMLANEGEKELLLSYEKQGFGCLYHCQAQGGAQETSPGASYLPQFRDMEKAEANFVEGMRAMETAGFTAYKYWVAPYGVDDAEILTIPRRHGFNCLITMGQFGHISPANCDRWHIPRWHLSPAEFNARGLNSFKQVVDACIADYGWLIIVTHCNEWDSTTTMDTALADAAQYAIDAGMDVRNFPDAFEIFKPFFYANEMF